MSERGSWCSEYIYCDTCRKGFAAFLVETGATPLPDGKYWSGGEITHGIFAGRIGGLYAKEELYDWEHSYMETLAPHLCHRVRLAVLAEAGEQFFTVEPGLTPR